MQFIQNTPQIKVLVDNSFLNKDKPEGFTEGYLVAVVGIGSRPLLFNVHLRSGGLYNRLPINALYCDRFDKVTVKFPMDLALSQPFSCLNGSINVIEYDHLKNYQVDCKIGESLKRGHYLFTVDVMGGGLAEDPEQYKAHNVIVLQTGNLVALPNNKILWEDEYFTDANGQWPRYRPQSKYHLAGG